MAARADPPSIEILEHTADIGLRVRAKSMEELFERAAWGLAQILDASRPSQGVAMSELPVVLAAGDLEGLLVDWMNELIVATEDGRACVGGVSVQSVSKEGLRGKLALVDCGTRPQGTELKAATYHQLSVRQASQGLEATVYFDV